MAQRQQKGNFDLDPATWRAIANAANDVAPLPNDLDQAAPVSAIAWKNELLADHGAKPEPKPETPQRGQFVEPPSGVGEVTIWPPIRLTTLPSRPAPLGPGERLSIPKVRPLDRLPPKFPGWRPGTLPPNGKPFLDLVDYVYGAEQIALMRAILAEPLFGYALRRWQAIPDQTTGSLPPGAEAARRQAIKDNLDVLHALYDRLSGIMATYLAFAPAPIVQIPRLPGRFIGAFYPGADIIVFSESLLVVPLHEVVNTIVHEQTHAMQHGRMNAGLRGLEPFERSVVMRWLHELPVLRQIPYRERAIELHAFDVGDRAAEVVKGMGRRC